MEISDIYRAVLSKYRSTMPKSGASPAGRKWLLDAYPNLDRGHLWNRTLYDMNVMSWNVAHTSGICLPVALFVKELMVEKDPSLEDEIDIIGLFDQDESRDKATFCHAVLAWKGKHYDVFFPEGQEDLEQMMFAKECKLRHVPEKQIRQYTYGHAKGYLDEIFFDKIKEEIPNVHSHCSS